MQIRDKLLLIAFFTMSITLSVMTFAPKVGSAASDDFGCLSLPDGDGQVSNSCNSHVHVFAEKSDGTCAAFSVAARNVSLTNDISKVIIACRSENRSCMERQNRMMYERSCG